jgi:hypothetical protein
MFIRYDGPRIDVYGDDGGRRRHINSTCDPADTLTIARPPTGECIQPGCKKNLDHLEQPGALRAGEVEITEAEYLTLLDANDVVWLAEHTASRDEEQAFADEADELEPWKEITEAEVEDEDERRELREHFRHSVKKLRARVVDRDINIADIVRNRAQR